MTEQQMASLTELHRILSVLAEDCIKQPWDVILSRLKEFLPQFCRHAGFSSYTLYMQEADGIYRLDLPEPTQQTIQAAFINTSNWIKAQLQAGGIFIIDRTLKYSDITAADESYLLHMPTQREIYIPLSAAGSVCGVLSFQSNSLTSLPSAESTNALQLLGAIVALAFAGANEKSGNAMYEKLAELEAKQKFELLLINLSGMFINLDWKKIDEQINESLRQVLEHFDLDRATLLQYDAESKDYVGTHQYARNALSLMGISHYKEFLPWIYSEVVQQKTIIIPDTAQLPEAAKVEREFALASGVKSNLTFPLLIDKEMIGVLSVGVASRYERWTPETIASIKMAGNVLANALERKQKSQQLEQKTLDLESNLSFQRIVSSLSSLFLDVRWENVDDAIENALGTIVNLFGFERGTILELNESKDDVVVSHEYPRSDVRTVGRTGFKNIVPWYVKQMLDGKTIILSSPNDFPPEAVNEIEQVKKAPFESTITLPLTIEGKVAGAFGFANYERNIIWNDVLIEQIKILSNIISNALARKYREAELAQFHEMLAAENIILRRELKGDYDFENILGESDALKYALYKIKQVAPLNTTVLIEGETGVGKQLFAYAIQQSSRRKDLPLLKVNCAALPANLIESELFGHEKGAFTGADKAVKGRFETAHGGTLFLDEIGDLPLELQPKLLRVLQDGEFERLGSSRTIKVDVRVIAATNRQLKEEVAAGKFRKDLYYRLSAYPITIPSLRDRREDIPILVEYYAKKFAKEMGRELKTISKEAMDKLTNYSWPGNVRELENVIERAVITSQGKVLKISETLVERDKIHEDILTLEEKEKEYILKVLTLTEGKIYGPGGAAEVLNVNPSTLRARLKKLGINKKIMF